MITRYIYFALGFICVGLGGLGVVLPILPTTPFLLLALWCFSRSSEKWKYWLLTNRWCGEYLDNYDRGNGISIRGKVYIIALQWIAISYSALFIIDDLWLQILLFAIATGVTIHICMVKTKR